ncbi:hypothetical protein EYF80_019852 [Liparis tanakae]|uniref:Uncharacterized protein n=1 Tax=Liparis tanakae TaxID=230148 RepID=A0A4Z2HVW3_9TELE|nr:hypothetical protein EYF80_019852 [Liparis tanakae]
MSASSRRHGSQTNPHALRGSGVRVARAVRARTAWGPGASEEEEGLSSAVMGASTSPPSVWDSKHGGGASLESFLVQSNSKPVPPQDVHHVLLWLIYVEFHFNLEGALSYIKVTVWRRGAGPAGSAAFGPKVAALLVCFAQTA